jgi:hypothetical protein
MSLGEPIATARIGCAKAVGKRRDIGLRLYIGLICTVSANQRIKPARSAARYKPFEGASPEKRSHQLQPSRGATIGHVNGLAKAPRTVSFAIDATSAPINATTVCR